MRVGDTERAAIADRLAKHFSDGRLDEAEFNDRLDRAMRAKTMADLTGLLSDLPDAEAVQPQPAAAGRRQHRKMLKVQLERERLRLKHERRHHQQAERQRRAHTLRWVPVLVIAGIVAVFVLHTLTHSIGAWLVLGLIAFLWLRRNNSGYRGD
jgi:Flp pilus assembly protein TadB